MSFRWLNRTEIAGGKFGTSKNRLLSARQWREISDDDLRAIHRPANLEFVHTNAEHFVIVGPLKLADGLIIGSLLIVNTDDEAAARVILADDPYLTGGVWQLARVNEYSLLLGDWA